MPKAGTFGGCTGSHAPKPVRTKAAAVCAKERWFSAMVVSDRRQAWREILFADRGPLIDGG